MHKHMKIISEYKTFGVTSAGERGHIVIPSEIREKMNLKKERSSLFSLVIETMSSWSKLTKLVNT